MTTLAIDPLLRRAEVEEMVGLRRSAIYDRMSKGNFPRPATFKDSNRVRWRKSEIDAWIEDQLVS